MDKKKFYHEQRLHAEETGDQATTDKIYSKLGKSSHSVDSNMTDKAALALGPGIVGPDMLGMGAMGAAKAGSALVPAASAGIASMARGAMGGMEQGARVVGQAVTHPIDHALMALEGKMPGVLEKIEQAIGEHHESLGGVYPGKTYTKVAESAEKTVSKAVSKPRATPKAAAPKTTATKDVGVKAGAKPSIKGGDKAKPGPSVGKTAAAPRKAAARAPSTPKNPYSKEGITAIRGAVPKNVRRQKKGV